MLLCCITLSSSRENQRQCSRGSKKDFWRRCRGGLRESQHTKYPSQTLIYRITFFAIFLSFSSPPLHPCRFICPLFSVCLHISFCSSHFLPLCLKFGKLLSIWTITITWKILMLLLKNPLSYIQKNSELVVVILLEKGLFKICLLVPCFAFYG